MRDGIRWRVWEWVREWLLSKYQIGYFWGVFIGWLIWGSGLATTVIGWLPW